MGDRPTMELIGALQSLYNSRDYADLTIVCNDGSRHAVHRAIVCPRSNFFAAAVREGKWQEGVQGEIFLAEDDPETVSLMIEYFYFLDYVPDESSAGGHEESQSNHDTMSVRTEAGQYGHVYGTSAVSAFGGPAHNSQSPFSPVFRHRADSTLTVHALPQDHYGDFSGPTSSSSRRRNAGKGGVVHLVPEPSPLARPVPHLTTHAKVYALGAKYAIGGLMALALDKFKIQLTAHWDSPDFAEAIHVVYNSTPANDKDMREIVADALGWYARLLDKPEIEVAVLEINGLAYALLKRSRRTEPEYLG